MDTGHKITLGAAAFFIAAAGTAYLTGEEEPSSHPYPDPYITEDFSGGEDQNTSDACVTARIAHESADAFAFQTGAPAPVTYTGSHLESIKDRCNELYGPSTVSTAMLKEVTVTAQMNDEGTGITGMHLSYRY